MSGELRLARLHRRAVALLALAGLSAFVGGAGGRPLVPLAAAALGLSLFWQPGGRLAVAFERVGVGASLLLTVRAVFSTAHGGDVVSPWADLLFMLLALESLRPLDARNDLRLYALCFALLIAATAFEPGPLFAVSFAAFAALAGLTLLLGFLRRHAHRTGWPAEPPDRTLLLATARLALLTLLVAGLVFAAFPRLSRGWISRGSGPALVTAGFGNGVSLGEHGATIQRNTDVVLRVEFPEGRPRNVEALHWRGRSYDHFDGVRWSRSRGLPRSSPRPEWYATRWTEPVIRQEIYASRLDNDVLFGLHPVVGLVPRSIFQPFHDDAGDLRYDGGAGPAYTLYSIGAPPDAASLRAAPDGPGRPPHYLQLPQISPRIQQLADSLVRNAGSRYDRVRAVERWLQTEFAYTRDLPASPREATLEAFLFRRRAGHCEYFSTAMAVLLRAADIPARNLTGFLGGEWNAFGQYLTVTQERAHSWVEVWFPGFGWVPFDPTPASVSDSFRRSSPLLAALRRIGDGLEHRWNKWVLQYDFEQQLELGQRLVQAFTPAPAAERIGDRPFLPPVPRLLAALLGAAAVVLLFTRVRRGRGRTALAPESRVYLELRRAYARRGFGEEPLPPLAFADALRRDGAPGAQHAARATALYLRGRFGMDRLSALESEELQAEAGRAARALRAVRPSRRRGRPARGGAVESS